LQQVFLNIINNAFAAIENSGQIDIAIEERGHDRLAVMITDNGKGIPKDELERIFEPFFTTKKEYGTGLGLSITYGIIKKLGGDIFVKSRVGVGTTFTVILPFRVSESGE
jgi:two-component system NtrC family sensor kinase